MEFNQIFSSLVFCYLTILLSEPSIAEYHSATVEIIRALNAGRKLASELDHYVNLEEERLDKVRSLAKRLASNHNTPGPKDEPEEFFGNPVNAYITVKRLAVDWNSEMVQSIKNTLTSNELELTKDMADVLASAETHASMLPGHSDADGAADAILRLQDVYRLQASELASGRVTKDITGPTLSAAQCMHIGRQAYKKEDYTRAEEWFRTAHARLQEELQNQSSHSKDSDDDEPKPAPVYILDSLSYALGRQGRYAEALNVTKMMTEIDPTYLNGPENAKFYEDRISKGEGRIGRAPPPQVDSNKWTRETADYEAVCRDESPFPPAPSNALNCRYYIPHPYYLIGPIKEEDLYHEPKIVMWYQMIHPKEIKHIQQLAMPKLNRATIKNPVTGNLEVAYYRTSKSAWLSHEVDEVTERLYARLHRVAQLNPESSEEMQVGNYGIGGHYAPHFDFGRKREKDAFERVNGNRIATIIFYFTEVKAGGATAFNRIGARVTPVAGAAAFWYNLFPSGEGDLRTRHAACPVLVGSKWVMNVWFHERGQEFRRRCDLEQGTVEIDDGM